MHFSIEEPYWKNKAEQFMIQLGMSEESRREIQIILMKNQPEDAIQLYKKILNEASVRQPSVEEISPHADDQELHAELQRLPFELRAAVALSSFHQIENNRLEQLVDSGDVQEGLRQLADQLKIDNMQTRKLLQYLAHTYEKKEMSEIETEELTGKAGPEEIEVRKKRSLIKPLAVAAGAVAALSAAMLLLSDPVSPTEDQSSGDQVEEEGEEETQKAEPIFSDEEIDELKETLKQNKEQLSQTLSLPEEEINMMMVSHQAEAHLSYIERLTTADSEHAHGNVSSLKDSAVNMIDMVRPPLKILKAAYDEANEMIGYDEIDLSDVSVSIFMHIGSDFLTVYQNKLEQLITAHQYTEEQLKENHPDLFKSMTENGIEVRFEEDDQVTVEFGGERFIDETEFLHPYYRDAIASIHEQYLFGDFYSEDQNEEVLMEMPKILLRLESQIVKFYELEKDLNDSEDADSRYRMLQVPSTLSMNYTEMLMLLTAQSSMYDGSSSDEISEKHLTVWNHILQESEYEGTRLRSIISMQKEVFEENDSDRPDGWGSIALSPFKEFTNPMNFRGRQMLVSMPLEGYALQLYNKYAAEGNDSLKYLHPKTSILYFLNALQQGDYETAYSLMGGEELPVFEDFVSEAKQQEFNFDQMVDLVPSSSQVGEFDFQNQHGNQSMNFTLIKEDERFAVKYNARLLEGLSTGDDPDAL
ncbi:hypothetical protein [Jeotgalibacillus salarius]|uniref:Uncharacterized protein n=1 Tax=Jeotgalibacillus salarius TaxID=546023 RepID=A0A4Y8LL37_9BACL|nr:hypothetical protein [Jeotgalibacillus salarius]TFE03762.1 hypothetical protein E2626_00075 [Jeotgalibacillus salarius]